MNEKIDESWADFLKEQSVDAVRMSGGKLFHAAGLDRATLTMADQ